MNAVASESGRPVWLAILPNITEQVRHGGRTNQVRRAERQSANRADMLLELAGYAALDCPMPRIVRTRRELVHQQLTVALDEHFDRQNADEIHLFRNGPSKIGSGFFDCDRNAGRDNSHIENVIAMNILAD